MKISTLIKKLERIYDVEGNLEVRYTDTVGYTLGIASIEIDEDIDGKYILLN